MKERHVMIFNVCDNDNAVLKLATKILITMNPQLLLQF